jgi:hypothetical protein
MTFGEHGSARKISQSHVQGGTVFRAIDRLASKERRAALFDPGSPSEIKEQSERRCGDPVFRIVEKKIVEFDVKSREPVRVIAEKVSDRLPLQRLFVRVERGKSGFDIICSHASHPNDCWTQASRFKMAKESAEVPPLPIR